MAAYTAGLLVCKERWDGTRPGLLWGQVEERGQAYIPLSPCWGPLTFGEKMMEKNPQRALQIPPELREAGEGRVQK